jgi:hypothetical protein
VAAPTTVIPGDLTLTSEGRAILPLTSRPPLSRYAADPVRAQGVRVHSSATAALVGDIGGYSQGLAAGRLTLPCQLLQGDHDHRTIELPAHADHPLPQ